MARQLDMEGSPAAAPTSARAAGLAAAVADPTSEDELGIESDHGSFDDYDDDDFERDSPFDGDL